VKYFTKLTIHWGYNNVQIKEGDNGRQALDKQGCSKPYSCPQFINSPAIFQMMINKIFKELINRNGMAWVSRTVPTPIPMVNPYLLYCNHGSGRIGLYHHQHPLSAYRHGPSYMPLASHRIPVAHLVRAHMCDVQPTSVRTHIPVGPGFLHGLPSMVVHHQDTAQQECGVTASVG